MATKVIVPSEGGDICIVSECVASVGDHVDMGDLICSVETDKAMIDVVAPCEGTVLAILHEEGDEIQAFQPIAIIGNEGEDIEGLLDEEEKEEVPEEPTGTIAPVPEVAEKKPVGHLASPRAKRYAKEHGISLEGIQGTGFAGSIVEQDVMAYVKTGKTDVGSEEEAQAYIVRTLSKTEKASGTHVWESLQQSAQFTLTARARVDRLLRLRSRFKKDGEILQMQSITINDLFCFAVAKTLSKFTNLNAVWNGDELREYQTVNLGVAVNTEEGLVVPVIKDAQKLSLYELSVRSHELAGKCKEHKQTIQDLSGGTFTVSNLGSYGIEGFTPILNTPQVAMLGVGAPVGRLILEDGQVKEIKEVTLSLTIDHRAVDGVPGAQFLKALVQNIEDIDILLGR